MIRKLSEEECTEAAIEEIAKGNQDFSAENIEQVKTEIKASDKWL